MSIRENITSHTMEYYATIETLNLYEWAWKDLKDIK